MTAQDKTRTEGLLEQILKRVQSIDNNVEEVLDQLSDHFYNTGLDLNGRGHEYANGNDHDVDKHGYEL